MESRKERKGWAVPQFGGWDHKTNGVDYSMVFSRARANRKQQKVNVKVEVEPHTSVVKKDNAPIPQDESQHCSSKRKKLLGYLCIRA